MALDWIEREVVVRERGIILPFVMPEKRNYQGEVYRESYSGDVFVEDRLLYDLLSTDAINQRLLIDDKEVQQALEDAGWINVSVRGSVYVSETFKALMEEAGEG